MVLGSIGRTMCVHCTEEGHQSNFAYCLTCGSYVCSEHMERHEKWGKHIVSWSLSKRFNLKATIEYLSKKEAK